MPPRYAYWTILIDNQPTAFRARSRDDLLPTLHQLQRRNPNAVMKWFARGRLWDTPEQARWASRNMERPPRGRDWRPGGAHKDPRAKPARRRERSDRRKTAGAPAGADRPKPHGNAQGRGRFPRKPPSRRSS